MTTTVFTRGSEWGSATLYDSWGPDVSEAEADQLSRQAVDRFHELARQAGDPSIHWLPTLSAVHGEVYGQDTDEHSKWDAVFNLTRPLNDLHEQAMNEVWEAFMGEV